MNELDVLEKLSSTSSTNDKAKILENNKNNKPLLELLEACFNYERKFFIKKFAINPLPPQYQECDQHKYFLELINKLENRVIVGNEARTEVEHFMSACSVKQARWYTRILRKDLKAGVSEKTVAKFVDIPEFDVQLAKDGKDCKKAKEIIEKGVFLSPKFDGYRCLAVIENNHVTLFSRNGTVYDNFPTIEESLLKAFPNQNLVLDGEIMSDDFQAMQSSAFASKRGTTVGDVVFYTFDTIDFDEWTTKKFVEKKSERYKKLVNLAMLYPDNIQLVVQDLVFDMATVLTAETNYINLGFEGAMTCPDIPYYLGKRSNKLLKWKTFKSEDCEIIGFYEGKDDTKHVGRMGGFILKQENGLTCECGSGFSDEDRDYIWNNQSEFLGRIVEVKYQEKTQHDIMRFPVFRRYRNDKSGEAPCISQD
jgi:DNA ligase-1